ncbi:hypothetical protein KXD40_007761 [Peronospora effusa]|nr:hypothetical protein KXD40_007761 [Peronospora effusa]
MSDEIRNKIKTREALVKMNSVGWYNVISSSVKVVTSRCDFGVACMQVPNDDVAMVSLGTTSPNAWRIVNDFESALWSKT